MIRKNLYFLIICLFILLSFAGCSQETIPSVPPTETEAEQKQEVPKAKAAAVTDTIEPLTPYQLLNLGMGNAEHISFDYTLLFHETGDREKGSFYKSGELSSEVFTTKDMKGESLTVRMVERDQRVFYVMAAEKRISSYTAPTEGFILYEMMKAAASTPIQSLQEDSPSVFEYKLPFEQDDSVTISYRFFVQGNILLRLEISMDGLLQKTYEFSSFSQEAADCSVFALPEDYESTDFDYGYDSMHMPPWWENDGLGDI